MEKEVYKAVELEENNVEDLIRLNGLRRSRSKRVVKEPTWMGNYIKGRKGKARTMC